MSEEQKNRQDEQEQPAAAAPPTAVADAQPAEPNTTAADAQTVGPGTTAAAAAPPTAEQNEQPAEQNEQAADEPSPIRCAAVLDGKMQARIGRENRSTGILFAVLGAAALAFGILFLTLPALGGEDASFFGWLLAVLGGLLLLCGVTLLLLLLRSVRAAGKQVMTNEYAFFENYFTVTTARRGEEIGSVRFGYADLYKIKEKYGLLQLFTAPNVVYPVDTAALSPEELAALRERLAPPQP